MCTTPRSPRLPALGRPVDHGDTAVNAALGSGRGPTGGPGQQQSGTAAGGSDTAPAHTWILCNLHGDKGGSQPMPPPPNGNLGYTAAIRIVPSVLAMAFAVGFAATTLAALLPAYRASRTPVADALRENV